LCHRVEVNQLPRTQVIRLHATTGVNVQFIKQVVVKAAFWSPCSFHKFDTSARVLLKQIQVSLVVSEEVLLMPNTQHQS